MPAQGRAFLVVQHQIRHQHIDRPDRQPRRRFRTVATGSHIVTETRQDSCNEVANWSIRLRQEDLRHRPL
jgi:hypothetical protein